VVQHARSYYSTSGGKEYTLHVHSTLHREEKGARRSILLVVERGIRCTSILLVVERNTACTSILLVVERGAYTLLAHPFC
jgi:hypothetical protein